VGVAGATSLTITPLSLSVRGIADSQPRFYIVEFLKRGVATVWEREALDFPYPANLQSVEVQICT